MRVLLDAPEIQLAVDGVVQELVSDEDEAELLKHLVRDVLINGNNASEAVKGFPVSTEDLQKFVDATKIAVEKIASGFGKGHTQVFLTIMRQFASSAQGHAMLS